jgi:hypothetical protein
MRREFGERGGATLSIYVSGEGEMYNTAAPGRR